jgi:hypothetical protein
VRVTSTACTRDAVLYRYFDMEMTPAERQSLDAIVQRASDAELDFLERFIKRVRALRLFVQGHTEWRAEHPNLPELSDEEIERIVTEDLTEAKAERIAKREAEMAQQHAA